MATSVDSTNYACVSMGPSSDGLMLTKSASDKMSAFGAAPVAQQTTATTPTNTGAWSTDGTAVVAAVVAIKTALDNLGFTA